MMANRIMRKPKKFVIELTPRMNLVGVTLVTSPDKNPTLESMSFHVLNVLSIDRLYPRFLLISLE